MAVVKNMIVRVGADVSDLVSNFKKASGVTGSFTKQFMKSLGDTRRMDSIKQLTKEHQLAENSVGNLKDKLFKLENSYASIVEAADGIDLGKSVSAQIAEQEKAYSVAQNKYAKLENQINRLKSKGVSVDHPAMKSAKLSLSLYDDLVEKIHQEMARLKEFSDLGKELGFEDINPKGLNKLQAEISETIAELSRAESTAISTGAELKRLQERGSWKNILLQGLKSIGLDTLGVVGNGLQRLGRKAKSSSENMEGLVRSIRRIGIVSLGLRFVQAILGELGSVVHQYVAENAALQAQVNALKSSFGQALAPAINLVTNALSLLMPYVVGVSNAIGSLISNLAGAGWTTVAADANAAAKAISGAGGAQKEFNRTLQGFDEITKLEAQSSGGGGGSSATATAPVEGKLPSWMTGLVDQITLAVNAGDWAGLGHALADSFTNLVKSIDWAGAFKSVGSLLGGVGAAIWGAVGDSLRAHWDAFWKVTNDMGGDILAGIFYGIGVAVHKTATWVNDNFLKPLVDGFKSTFKIHSPSTHPEITGIGKNIMLGVLEGLLAPLADPVGWIKDNIFTPLSEGFKLVFGDGIAGLFSGESGSSMEVDAQVNFTTWKDKLRNKVIDAQSRFTTWKDGLKNKVIDFKSNLTSWGDRLKNKAVDFKSNLTSWGDCLKNKAVDFKSNLTSWGDCLKNKAVDFKSNLTSWSDSLKSKVLPFQSNLTAWKDCLNDKILNFGANVHKGWSGKLEDTLGISKLKSRLEIEAPDIEVQWTNSKSPGGTGFVEKPTFKVEFNAAGRIFNGATLFGMVGNRLQVAGEAGREALLPLDRNTWWMDDIADRTASRLSGGVTGGETTINVNLIADGKALASTVVRHVNAQARATGKNPLATYM